HGDHHVPILGRPPAGLGRPQEGGGLPVPREDPARRRAAGGGLRAGGGPAVGAGVPAQVAGRALAPGVPGQRASDPGGRLRAHRGGAPRRAARRHDALSRAYRHRPTPAPERRARCLPRVPRGTPGFEVCPELAPRPTELIVDKNATSAFTGSSLDLYLRNLGVQNLVVTGTSTNHCVDNTARDAADRGFNVILVDDACADGNVAGHCATMTTFPRHFGIVRRADEVIALFARLLAPEPAGVR